ncbi:MAG TPA: amidase [Pyrinomonadaceae bacterium]|jgi:amidase|nr:amidase [Pyrinomonadaceae bacterium]
MSRKKKDAAGDSALNRRGFLRRGVLGGALAFVSPSLAFGETNDEMKTPSNMEAAPVKSFEYDEATIGELQEALTRGRLSARSLAEKYLTRIEEIDRSGPRVNSVIETNRDALAIAEASDAERKRGSLRGPLHGIPVLIKDNIDTADRMSTTAGSLALVGAKPARDAVIVERLRAAGAVLLGKTNLSEWANFRSTHSSSGWSARGGQTRNPYVLDRNPCGSSSGSGVAVAANLCAVAVGTETDGSIVCPASANGVVGIKPTLGLLSGAGIIPIAHSQDTAGPMARTVADAAILLGALAGTGERNAAPRDSRRGSALDYTKFLDPAGLRGARLGIARKFFGFSDKVDKLLAEAIDTLKRLGAIVVDPADIPSHGKFDDSEFEVLLYEFKADLNAYLARLGGDARVRSLKEIIRFNEQHRDEEMPYFGQEIFQKAEEKGPLTSRAYRAALRKNHLLARAQGIDAVMSKHRLDAIVGPTGGPPWTTDLVNGDHFSGGSSTPAAVAGYPNITVPAGFIHGLPVGISFFGRADSEPVLIRLAYAFEQATKHRKPPQFLPTADLR